MVYRGLHHHTKNLALRVVIQSARLPPIFPRQEPERVGEDEAAFLMYRVKLGRGQMSDSQKYYYLKLKENFYDEDKIKIIESLEDGFLYSNILMKLYLKSLKHGGAIQISDRIPYKPEILAKVLSHPVGVLEKAVHIFKELDLIEILEDGTIWMLEIENYIGHSSTEGDRKRAFRKKINDLKKLGYNPAPKADESPNKCPDKCPDKRDDERPPETEIEIETEIELEKEIEKERIGGEAPRVRPEAFPLSSIKTLFGVWIGAGLRKHKWETVEFTITNDNYKKKKYSKPLIGVGFDAIKDAIINYGEIMGDHDEYWFSHQYDFWDFLARGFSKFLPDAEPKLKFRRREEERFDRKKTVVEETAKQRRERLQREGVI